jgi:hypothetical protein
MGWSRIPILVLIAALIAQPALVRADPPAPGAPPEEPTLPWLLGRLEGRFEILAAGHQLLRDSYDIDAVVGDPWTLKPETLAALEHLPYRARLSLAELAARNLDDGVQDGIFLDEPYNGRSVLRIELGDQGSAQLLKSAEETVLGGLTPDQMIDLGIFVLSKAPFFPKDQDGWKKLKKKIVLYDVYLALIAVAAGLAANEGRIGFGGWLFKADQGEFRVGWYATGKKLGFKMKPGYTAGLRVRARDFDTAVGVAGDQTSDERFAVEAVFSERWWARVLRDSSGWDLRGTVRARWVLKHVDPALENVGRVSGETVLTKRGVFGLDDYLLALKGSLGINTRGRMSGGATAVLESGHGGWFTALSADVDTDGLSVYRGTDFRLSAFVGGSTESRFETLRGRLRWQAASVRRDLEQIDRHRRELIGAPDDAARRNAAYWLGNARRNLRRHLAGYEADAREYDSLRTKSDGSSRVVGLSESELADARWALDN